MSDTTEPSGAKARLWDRLWVQIAGAIFLVLLAAALAWMLWAQARMQHRVLWFLVRRAGRRDPIALGPSLLAGAVLAWERGAEEPDVETPGFERLEQTWEDRAPLGWDNGDQVPTAKAVVALLSDWFPATTGEIVHVDGGFHAVGV